MRRKRAEIDKRVKVRRPKLHKKKEAETMERRAKEIGRN